MAQAQVGITQWVDFRALLRDGLRLGQWTDVRLICIKVKFESVSGRTGQVPANCGVLAHFLCPLLELLRIDLTSREDLGR